MKWYYLAETREVAGPVTEEALREMLDSGSLSETSQICREGTEGWIELKDALELFPQWQGSKPQSRPSESPAGDGVTRGSRRKKTSTAIFSVAGALLVLGAAVVFWATTWSEGSASLDSRTELTAHLSKEGVPDDPKQTFSWYRKAAEQGDAEAQNVLAMMYSAGQGVEQNRDEARKWWGISAEGGNPYAQYREGERLKWASGGEGDIAVRAYVWFDLAASGNDRKVARAAKKRRGELDKTLSSVEIEEAKKMSGDWKPKPLDKLLAASDRQESNRKVENQPSPTRSLNTDLDAAIRAIAAVYPELSREEHIRKLEEISGLRMNTPANARQARAMVNKMRGAAKISGKSEREFSDWSEQKRKELEKDINGVRSGPE